MGYTRSTIRFKTVEVRQAGERRHRSKNNIKIRKGKGNAVPLQA